HFAPPFRARSRRRIPTGFRPPAQGCAAPGATLGNTRQTQSTPTGLRPSARRLSAIPETEFAKPVCAKHTPGGGCSLSSRERVRVRGNGRSSGLLLFG